ncbi:MAG: hypothetical protein U5L98_08430 [Halomonas sp.]|uniref:hypothetical protein n=1 Tax=Halomonas sp. TaxID=1486246 RepID=UPI002ACEF631|nr:hypothetical protein [Halomonas sp.]MDZ7852655.1 hypothetical protein [Halomonas sp.]
MNRSVVRRIAAVLVVVALVLGAGVAYAQPADGDTGRDAADPGSGYVLLNPLGFLQFGPILEGGFRVAGETYVGAHLRFSGMGVLYHVINTDFGSDESSVSPLSIGPAVTFHTLLPYTDTSNRFYAGGALGMDFGWSSGTDSVGDWEARWRSIVLATNFGHRWRNPSGFFINVGLIAGFAVGIESNWNYVDEPDDLQDDGTETTFYGMLEFSLGRVVGQ